MNLAILQPVPDERSRRSPYVTDIAVLAGALRARRHAVTLSVLDRCDEAELTALMAAVHPQVVLLYVEPLAADLAFRMAGVLARVRQAEVGWKKMPVERVMWQLRRILDPKEGIP